MGKNNVTEPVNVTYLIIAVVLCNRFIQAKEMVQETIRYYEELTSIVPPALAQKWEKEISVAEGKRLQKPEAMDIIGAQDIHIRPGPSPSDQPQNNMEWLDLALSMEERQYGSLLKVIYNF
jgi:hypothetical protein